MNLPSQATIRNMGVKARQPAVVTGACLGVELGLDGFCTLPLQVARGLAAAAGPGAVVQGAVERSLAVEGLLDSFFLHRRARDAAGCVMEPRTLAPGRRLGAEVVEVLHEPRRPYLAEGEAARGMARGSPLRR